MKDYITHGVIIALALLAFSGSFIAYKNSDSFGALRVLMPSQGGTGTGVTPTDGDVLVAQSDGTYTPSSLYLGFSLTMPGATFSDISGIASGGTTTVIYTVGAGEKLLLAHIRVTNLEATTTRVIGYVNRAGILYTISAGSNLSALGNANVATGNNGFVLEPGDSFLLFSSTTIRYALNALSTQDTFPYKTVATTTFASSTSNLLYTVPAGKTAYIVGTNTSIPYVAFANVTGATVQLSSYSGTSVSTTTLLTSPAGATNSTVNSLPVERVLHAGESIYIGSNSATAGQTAWIIVYEF